jgi:hypothetical protein
MEKHTAPGQTRRELLRASCVIPLALGLAASGRQLVQATRSGARESVVADSSLY